MKSIQLFLCALLVVCSVAVQAQQTVATAIGAAVPPLVNYSGVLTAADSKPLTGAVTVTFSLYKEQQGGGALWTESQSVQANESGHYLAMLGSTASTGLPSSLFSSVEAHWLGVRVEGQEEQPRVLLVSAPYALKAGDAETIGGLPASAFLLAPSRTKPGSAVSTAATPANAVSNPAAPPPASVTGSGTKNYIPRWTSTSAIGNSIIYQTGTGSTAKVGVNTTAPGLTFDVAGQGRFSVSTTSSALLGSQTGTGTAGNGVLGTTTATAASGVYGSATAKTGTSFGVYGIASSKTGTGVYGSGGVGVEGFATFCCNYAAIFTGYSAPSKSGNDGGPGLLVHGGSGDTQDTGTGGGAGIVTFGGTGMGQFSGVGGDGIQSTAGNGYGDVGDGIGGYFLGGNGALQGGDGVDAIGGSGTGVVAFGGSGNSSNGFSSGDGIDAYAGPDFDSFAGYFIGDVVVTGALSSGVKDFKIDHPQDPANKYLVHASVESSEMVNIYSGNVVTDGEGNATVQMPKWFETLNTDFRYQLTPLGQFAQAIVATEISNNQFTIRTDKPNVKVSWQVTGVRQDAFAKAHPLVVEQPKEARLHGYYLHPELFGAPAEKGMSWGRHPLAMKRMQAHRAKARLQEKTPQPATVAQAK